MMLMLLQRRVRERERSKKKVDNIMIQRLFQATPTGLVSGKGQGQ